MSYNLFLDDQRLPRDCRDFPGDGSAYDSEEWIVANSFDEFYRIIKDKGIPKLVSFDFQLCRDKNGLDCAEFLKFECEEVGVPIPKYRVHSGWPGIYGKFVHVLGSPTEVEENLYFIDWKDDSSGNYVGWIKEFKDFNIIVSRIDPSKAGKYDFTKVKSGINSASDPFGNHPEWYEDKKSPLRLDEIIYLINKIEENGS